LQFNKAQDRFIKNLELLDRSSETIKGYTKSLKALKKYLQDKYNGPVYVTDITRADLEDYLHHLKSRGLAPQSRSHALYVMRSFFKYLHQSGEIAANPAALLGNIKLRQSERPYLTGEEVDKLAREVTQPAVKVMVTFLYHTGLRLSEATSLKLDDVDLEDNLIRVVAGKGNKDRVVPINEKLAGALRRYLQNTRPKVDSDKFFATEKTGAISNQYVGREIRAAVKRLGWDQGVSAHTLRHSYATALVQNNVNIVHVSRLLGHSSVKTTSVYAHSPLDELRRSVEAL